MSNQQDDQDSNDAVEAADDAALSADQASADQPSVSDKSGSQGAGQLGVTRYVHAAFLGVAVGVAYVSGKLLEAIWNTLASWPVATAQVPLLVRYREDERPAFTMTAGLILGVVFGYWLSHQVGVRRWADDVASELAKVHWPSREMVQNGTVVVVVAGLFATVYVGLLDRFWVFVTTLVYGA